MSFEAFVQRAAGHRPYGYQARLADEGLPDVLAVPTGAGKTLAATLPWLYRRCEHPDEAVRSATPRWLVLALPMRVLVEQTFSTVEGWLRALDLTDDVGLYRVMGGEGRQETTWRHAPERDAIFVSTLDMVLSRALNRGYGESRWVWPIDFGLLNASTQWVFDEVQLMGPALPTSRQLAALRGALGGAAPSRTMWMSATVSLDQLVTVDNPVVGRVAGLDDDDREGPLRRRLHAVKTVGELTVPTDRSYVSALADRVLDLHEPGQRTIVVLNTVARASDLVSQLRKRAEKEEVGAECVLVHSRFRPPDRQVAVDRALHGVDAGGPGRIVVSTQVLEAGVDISASCLVTELAPWPSIVQRAGRCNRDGEHAEASLRWVRPPRAAPYDDDALDTAAQVLRDLEGRSAAPVVLDALDVPVKDPLHPVLRRRDLVELFDTLPDLSGNDVDVARFIRSNDDIDVQVAWRELDGAPPDEAAPLPGREERCPVPIGELAGRGAWVDGRRVWRFDHLAERWVECRRADVRPGQVLIADAADGGYLPEQGWLPGSTVRVPEVRAGQESPLDGADTAVGADPVSYTRSRRWVSLTRHLGDVEGEVRFLSEELRPDLPPALIDAAVAAGRYHDVGKAHEVFQQTLKRSAATDDEKVASENEPAPWAKSGGSARSRHRRSYFRHELVSALALLPEDSPLWQEDEPELIAYLVAAHHGRVRLGFRALPGEQAPEGEPDRLHALGVHDGDELPEVELPGGGVVGACRLDLTAMLLGRSSGGAPSWGQRALALRDRYDLGPFRLAYLEALVRVADWRVSARYDEDADHEGGR